MTGMPAEDGLRLGERRHVLGGHSALHRNGPQIDEFQIVARFERLHRRRIERGAEARRVAKQPEKHGLARVPNARASAGENSGSSASPCTLSTTLSPPTT